MNFNTARLFATNLPSGLSASILVGKNGAGKSRFLVDLADYYREAGREVVAISNTPYDRFSGKKRSIRISVAAGPSLPRKLVVRAIVALVKQKHASGFFGITETLRYCGYEPELTFRIEAGGFVKYIYKRHGPNFSTLDYYALLGIFEEYFIEKEIKSSPRSILQFRHTESVLYALELLNNSDGTLTQSVDMNSSVFDASVSLDFANLLAIEDVLRRLQVIHDFSIEVYKNGVGFNLEGASSGELSLISIFVYLASAAPEGAVLLIDEPENSLHPEWQRDYVRRLVNLLNYRQPTIIIATHAPMIVSGARLEKDLQVGIYEARGDHLVQLNEHSPEVDRKSVEETLWEIFKIITPKSHFVSDMLANQLENLAVGKTSEAEFASLISDFKKSSFDPKQQEFFEAVRKLAENVVQYKSEQE